MVKGTDAAAAGAPRDRAFWAKEIEKGKQRFGTFWTDGDSTIDEYRQQKASGVSVSGDDKYNILYSSTETIRPNLYATEPNVRVQVRHKDRSSPVARNAVQLLENTLQYVIKEEDFDEVLENVVEDLLLPGLGQGWVRYEPTFGAGEGGSEEVTAEEIRLDYVYWQDFMTGVSRGWASTPWVARRVWMSKEDATKRFGADKAGVLNYETREKSSRDADAGDMTAEIWEIWDKTTKHVYWYAEAYPDELLDAKPDPLKLKRFFPCPRPLRAVSNTRTFVPRSLYSQYRSQAKTLNTMTRRIRLLSEALRVVGVYDASQAKLQNLLSPNGGNVMIPIDSWAMFAQQGGIRGNIEWVPIDAIVAALVQLQQARELAKQEIYEITGFSDIVRGVSKASETLGAQNLKANWASARLRKMQKDVQRFARDMIAIAGELVAELCSSATIALYGGVDLPTPEQVQADPNAVQALQMFQQSVKLLHDEKMRCAKIDIETDSTILADEEAERKDRMDFLGAAGAFLQQAVPAMEAMPQLGTLLGALLMFTVRTFPSSRPVEEEFDKLQKVLEQSPPQPKQDPGAGDAAAKAQSAMQVAQVHAGVETQKMQLNHQATQDATAQDAQFKQADLSLRQAAETNRHGEKMTELELKREEIEIRKRELALEEQTAAAQVALGAKAESTKAQQADTAQFSAQRGADTAEFTAQHGAKMAEASHEQKYDAMDQQERMSDAANKAAESKGDAS